jgi:hypothetical protein
MPDTGFPTASSRPLVTDMLYAALPTLPCGGTGDPGPQADEGLAIDPELGSRINSLLGRLFFGHEEKAVVMKQPNGGRRDYQVSSLRHECRGEERPDRPASFVLSVLRVAQFGGSATRMTVRLRWVGNNCWLNLQANPTTLLTGTNAFAADLGARDAHELSYLLRCPFYLLRRILRAIDSTFDWPTEMAARIRQGDIVVHNLQFAFSIPFDHEDDACRFLSCLQAIYCLQYVDERGRVRVLGKLLGLHASALFDDRGDSTGVLLRAFQGNNHDLTVNVYAKADTLEPGEEALLREVGMRWLRRHPRVDVTLHKPAIRRLFTAAGMPHGTPCTIGSVCRAVRALDRDGRRLVDWVAHEAFVRCLKLPAVVGFRNGDYERAAAELRNRPVVMAVWPRWLEGEDDLRDLLKAELLRRGTPETKVNVAVADNIRAVRRADIDPDIPPEFFHRLGLATCTWGFSKAELAAFNAAMVAGDQATVAGMQWEKRRYAERGLAELAAAVDRALRPGDVPALGAR